MKDPSKKKKDKDISGKQSPSDRMINTKEKLKTKPKEDSKLGKIIKQSPVKNET
jgi:hypothetical protein